MANLHLYFIKKMVAQMAADSVEEPVTVADYLLIMDGIERAEQEAKEADDSETLAYLYEVEFLAKTISVDWSMTEVA